MPFSAGPNIAARPNLVFEYDTGDVKNSYIGEPTTNLLTYSSAFNGGPWQGYCGNTSNLTYNTTDVVAPDGSYTALKVVRNNITNCGNNPCWGLLYSAGGTLVSGNTYTTSIWARCASGTVTMAFGLSDYYTTTVTLTTTWQRFTYIWNYNPPGQTDRVFQFFSTNQDITYYVWGAQTEMKSHATQYIASGASQGVRSNTQGLLDVSGQNNTINLASVSFTSAAQPTFDGTDDSMVVTNSDSFKNVNITVETVIKFNTFKSADLVQFGVGSGAYAQWYFRDYGDGRFNWFQSVPGTASYTSLEVSRSSLVTGRYYHIVCTASNGSSSSMYYNGALAGSTGATGTTAYSWTPANMTIGGFSWDGYSNTDIPLVRIYSQALSASEILRNYNQLKGRFNLP